MFFPKGFSFTNYYWHMELERVLKYSCLNLFSDPFLSCAYFSCFKLCSFEDFDCNRTTDILEKQC